MSTSIAALKSAIEAEACLIHRLDKYFESPIFVLIDGLPFFRHRTKSDLLVSYLKVLRALSSLRACIVLLEAGYVQEIGVLCRCIQDYCEDVLFLSNRQSDGKQTEQQTRFVQEFFQEEFDNPRNPFASTQRRNQVPRQKVHAEIARLPHQPVNSSDAQELHRTIHKAFSGYVHGAYPHIMEIYGGNPPKYCTAGMLCTPRIQEWTDNLVSYVLRLGVASTIVAKRCDDEDLANELEGFVRAWGMSTGSVDDEDIGKPIEDIKAR